MLTRKIIDSQIRDISFKLEKGKQKKLGYAKYVF